MQRPPPDPGPPGEHITKVRTGQAPSPLTRAQFQQCFNTRFYGPASDAEREAISRLETIARDALREGRKAPITQPAGRGLPNLRSRSPFNGWRRASA
jgi:hypothetical protein